MLFMGHALPPSRKNRKNSQDSPTAYVVDRKFLENKGFGDRSIEINDGEMPSEIFENRNFGIYAGTKSYFTPDLGFLPAIQDRSHIESSLFALCI